MTLADQANIVVLDGPHRDLHPLLPELKMQHFIHVFSNESTCLDYLKNSHAVDFIVIDSTLLSTNNNLEINRLYTLLMQIHIPVAVVVRIKYDLYECWNLTFKGNENDDFRISQPFSRLSLLQHIGQIAARNHVTC